MYRASRYKHGIQLRISTSQLTALDVATHDLEMNRCDVLRLALDEFLKRNEKARKAESRISTNTAN